MKSFDSLEPRPERLDISPKISIDSNVDSIYSTVSTPEDGRNPRRFRTVRCPICQASLAVEEKNLGTTIVCPDCDTKIDIPKNLCYNESEYEKKYYNDAQLRRDRLLSPLRNPNRDGIDLSAANVYGIGSDEKKTSDADANSDAARRSYQYRTVRCPLCETELAATRFDLGRTLICPDCGTKVNVPQNLDFTQTDSERRRFDRDKMRRDELLSPVRNPNRDGIAVDETNSYAIDSDSHFWAPVREKKRPVSAIYLTDVERAEREAERRRDEEAASTKKVNLEKTEVDLREKGRETAVSEYIPVRCRVCETLTQVPREMLGKTVRCPDCGTETVVSTAFQEQQRTTDVRFAPRERGLYEIGEIPEAPGACLQGRFGATVEISGSSRSTVASFSRKKSRPSVSPSVLENSRTKGRGIAPAEPSATPLRDAFESAKKRNERNDFNEDRGETQKRIRQEKETERLRQLREIEKEREKKDSKKSKRPRQFDDSRDSAPLVLRRRDGELVWTLAPPPKFSPLFNGTFRPFFASELWGRDVAVFCLSVFIAAFVAFIVAWSQKNGGQLEAQGYWGLLAATSLAFPAVGLLISLESDTFACAVAAGSGGSRRLFNGRGESPVGKFFYAVWLFLLIGASTGIGFAIFGGSAAAFDAVCAASNETNDENETNDAEDRVGATDKTVPTNVSQPSTNADETSIGFSWRLSVLFAGGFWFVFPIFFLSTSQSDALFWPLTGGIFGSFFSKWIVWTQFYAASAVILAVPVAVSLRFCQVSFGWALIPFEIVVVPVLYGLLLGRLGWIIDDEVRSAEFDD